MKTLLSLAVLSFAGVAYATPVTYTATFTGSGTLDGISYTNQLVTLTGTADTTNITMPSSGVYVVLSSATVTVGSGSAVSFTDSINVVDNHGSTDAGFGDANSNLAVEFTQGSAFAAYNLNTTFSSSGTSLYNPGDGYGVSGGSFVISSTTGTSTFSAVVSGGSSTVTPEPTSLALAGSGLLGVVGAIRRRVRRA